MTLKQEKELLKLAATYLTARWGVMKGNRVVGCIVDLPGCLLGMEDSKREMELVIGEMNADSKTIR